MFPRHLEQVEWSPHSLRSLELSNWPYSIPAVAQIIREGKFEVPPGITFFVGENGCGKSTLIEAFAKIYPRGGHETHSAAVVGPHPSKEDSPLAANLRARVHRFASPAGFFLRAEMMHEYLSMVDQNDEPRAWEGEKLQSQSHGESFLAVLRHRFNEQGVYFLDEPEAALSFHSSLALLALLDSMRREGSQVLIATHSPLLVTLPGASLIELGDFGFRRVDYFAELDFVQHWRSFLAEPDRYLRHVLGTN